MQETAISLPRWKIWWLASRPKTLWAAVAPVLIGTAMAYHDGLAHWPSALLAAVCAVLIQVGTNFANDFFDFQHGADHSERLGPMRVTQAGLVPPEHTRAAFILAFSLAFFIGIYLIYRGGWPLLAIGLLSILFGITYTGGPFPLGYYGLGDIFVLIFFGLIAVGGTYYVQALQFHWLVLLAGLAPGFFSTAILTVNNLRDIYTDKGAGKRTLAVRFGITFSRLEYLFSIVAGSLIPLLLFLLTWRHPWVLAACAVLLLAWPSIKIVFSEKPGIIFNEVLANTGKVLLIYSVLFSVGWIL
ncbi:MAG: 1,4-dihydroxy-2-naphthoate polyprenyltransferase [Calditrichia bacterium]